MATIKDVAKRANVSYTTVSHVINKTRYVSEENVRRVNEAIKELNYRPSQVARSLRIHESKTIGVLCPANHDPYFSEILVGIESTAYLEGYNVIVCYSEFDTEREHKNISMLLDKSVDAIISHCVLDEQHIDLLLEQDIPVIFLQQYVDDIGMDAFCTDDFTGGVLATQHLVDLGHTRIACIAGQSLRSYSFHQREKGWRKVLKENNITIDEMYRVRTRLSFRNGYKSFKDLMSLKHAPSAIFCYNDYIAIGVLRAAADLGVDIPGDVSVVGYDNLEIAPQCIPRLTTVSQLKADLGEMAVKRVLERIADDSIGCEKHIISPELVVRESTAPLKLA